MNYRVFGWLGSFDSTENSNFLSIGNILLFFLLRKRKGKGCNNFFSNGWLNPIPIHGDGDGDGDCYTRLVWERRNRSGKTLSAGCSCSYFSFLSLSYHVSTFSFYVVVEFSCYLFYHPTDLYLLVHLDQTCNGWTLYQLMEMEVERLLQKTCVRKKKGTDRVKPFQHTVVVLISIYKLMPLIVIPILFLNKMLLGSILDLFLQETPKTSILCVPWT